MNNTFSSATDAGLPYLHATLVSTNDSECVSLLIFIPSLMSSTMWYTTNIPKIECTAVGLQRFPPRDNQTIDHNIISGESLCTQ